LRIEVLFPCFPTRPGGLGIVCDLLLKHKMTRA